jgi:hypothetical protein
VTVIWPGEVLVATWGGTEYRWLSTPVLGLIAPMLPASIVVFVLALFIKQVSLRGREPSQTAPAPEAEALIG